MLVVGLMMLSSMRCDVIVRGISLCYVGVGYMCGGSRGLVVGLKSEED